MIDTFSVYLYVVAMKHSDRILYGSLVYIQRFVTGRLHRELTLTHSVLPAPDLRGLGREVYDPVRPMLLRDADASLI